MNYTTPIPVASSVIDIDALKAEARNLELPTDRPTLRRVRRAITILSTPNTIHPIGQIDDARIYEVQSQCEDDKKHLVVANGQVKCTCADARRGYKCKHSMAVDMMERTAFNSAISTLYQDRIL